MTTFIDNLFGEYTSHAFLPTLTEAVECGTPAGLVEKITTDPLVCAIPHLPPKISMKPLAMAQN